MSSRVVLVTGASSGIGRATARMLLERGDRVALLARHAPTLQEVAAGHADALVVPADLVDRDALRSAVDATVARFGRIDAVVHVAQVMAYGRIEDVDPDVYDRVVDVAMKGTANLARLVLPMFRQAGAGTLVVVNSLLGEIATPRMGAYDAAKWGQLGLARVLQLEVRDEKRVHVCIVSPGAVDTPIYDQAANYAGRGGFPPPPVVSPERVAQAALRCLERPRRHVEVGPVNQLAKIGFRFMPFVYDRIVGVMVKLAVFRGEPSGPNPGNVLETRREPRADDGRLDGPRTTTQDETLAEVTDLDDDLFEFTGATRQWTPRHVFVTRSAGELPHGRQIVARCEAAGVEDIRLLDGDRLPGLREGTEREVYARAKQTLAVVVAPPSQLRPQPIPPSADWRLDLAKGCPAHCQYCYLAGSLQGPPITRVYANLDDVLAPIRTLAGQGTVTTGTAERGHEGTTFELSCYTDPLGLEAVTGSLSSAISRVGLGEYGDGVGLRFTTKFDDVAPLVGLPHDGRTRVRLSVNSAAVSRRFEGGTASVEARLAALRAVARDGYPVGVTVAPVMPLPGWRDEYAALLSDLATATADVPGLDLTVELITHRFTETSREVLLSWYPATKLDLDEANRTVKRSKFGGRKYVYPAPLMRAMRTFFDAEIRATLPGAQVLYWT